MTGKRPELSAGRRRGCVGAARCRQVFDLPFVSTRPRQPCSVTRCRDRYATARARVRLRANLRRRAAQPAHHQGDGGEIENRPDGHLAQQLEGLRRQAPPSRPDRSAERSLPKSRAPTITWQSDRPGAAIHLAVLRLARTHSEHGLQTRTQSGQDGGTYSPQGATVAASPARPDDESGLSCVERGSERAAPDPTPFSNAPPVNEPGDYSRRFWGRNGLLLSSHTRESSSSITRTRPRRKLLSQ